MALNHRPCISFRVQVDCRRSHWLMRLSYTCNLASTVIAIDFTKFDVVCLGAKLVVGFIDFGRV